MAASLPLGERVASVETELRLTREQVVETGRAVKELADTVEQSVTDLRVEIRAVGMNGKRARLEAVADDLGDDSTRKALKAVVNDLGNEETLSALKAVVRDRDRTQWLARPFTWALTVLVTCAATGLVTYSLVWASTHHRWPFA